MVCSLLRDFHHSFAMTLLFFWASLFAIRSCLLSGWMQETEGIGDDFWGNRVQQEEEEGCGGG